MIFVNKRTGQIIFLRRAWFNFWSSTSCRAKVVIMKKSGSRIKRSRISAEKLMNDHEYIGVL